MAVSLLNLYFDRSFGARQALDFSDCYRDVEKEVENYKKKKSKKHLNFVLSFSRLIYSY